MWIETLSATQFKNPIIMKTKQYNTLWECIFIFDALCKKEDIKSCKREDLEDAVIRVYAKLTDLIHEL